MDSSVGSGSGSRKDGQHLRQNYAEYDSKGGTKEKTEKASQLADILSIPRPGALALLFATDFDVSKAVEQHYNGPRSSLGGAAGAAQPTSRTKEPEVIDLSSSPSAVGSFSLGGARAGARPTSRFPQVIDVSSSDEEGEGPLSSAAKRTKRRRVDGDAPRSSSPRAPPAGDARGGDARGAAFLRAAPRSSGASPSTAALVRSFRRSLGLEDSAPRPSGTTPPGPPGPRCVPADVALVPPDVAELDECLWQELKRSLVTNARKADAEAPANGFLYLKKSACRRSNGHFQQHMSRSCFQDYADGYLLGSGPDRTHICNANGVLNTEFAKIPHWGEITKSFLPTDSHFDALIEARILQKQPDGVTLTTEAVMLEKIAYVAALFQQNRIHDAGGDWMLPGALSAAAQTMFRRAEEIRREMLILLRRAPPRADGWEKTMLWDERVVRNAAGAAGNVVDHDLARNAEQLISRTCRYLLWWRSNYDDGLEAFSEQYLTAEKLRIYFEGALGFEVAYSCQNFTGIFLHILIEVCEELLEMKVSSGGLISYGAHDAGGAAGVNGENNVSVINSHDVAPPPAGGGSPVYGVELERAFRKDHPYVRTTRVPFLRRDSAETNISDVRELLRKNADQLAADAGYDKTAGAYWRGENHLTAASVSLLSFKGGESTQSFLFGGYSSKLNSVRSTGENTRKTQTENAFNAEIEINAIVSGFLKKLRGPHLPTGVAESVLCKAIRTLYRCLLDRDRHFRVLYAIVLAGDLKRLLYSSRPFGRRSSTAEESELDLQKKVSEKGENKDQQVRLLSPTPATASGVPLMVFRCDTVATFLLCEEVRARVRTEIRKGL